MDEKVSNKFNLLGFYFTLAIVIYHADIALRQSYADSVFQSPLSSLYGYFACLAMAFFFMKTGYFLYLNADNNSIGGKLKRRVRTIIVPFLIWNTLYFLLGLLIHGVKDDLGTMVYRYTFDPYDPPLWYLPAIFALAMFAPLILLCKNRWIQMIIGLGVAVLAVAVSANGLLWNAPFAVPENMVTWITRLCNYLPSYILGACAGIWSINLSSKKKIVRVIVGSVFGYLLCGRILGILNGSVALLNGARILSFFDGARMLGIPGGIQYLIAVVCLWYLLRDDTGVKNPKGGFDSFLIYATHGLVIFVMTFVVTSMIGRLQNNDSAVFGNFLCLILPAVTTAVVCVCVRLAVVILRRTRLEKVVKLLSGGR